LLLDAMIVSTNNICETIAPLFTITDQWNATAGKYKYSPHGGENIK
jgi:hypothetical protein